MFRTLHVSSGRSCISVAAQTPPALTTPMIPKNGSTTPIQGQPQLVESTNTGPTQPPQSWRQQFETTWANASGVHELAQLKQRVDTSSQAVDVAHRTLSQARQEAQQTSSHAQELAARHKQILVLHKQGTTPVLDTPGSIQAFAQLTADESVARRTASKAQDALVQAETQLHEAQQDYLNALRQRYHEEQVWQDKWRVLGTYWTWLLIGLNSVIFVVGQALYVRREEARMQALEAMLLHEFPETLLPRLNAQLKEDGGRGEGREVKGQRQSTSTKEATETVSDETQGMRARVATVSTSRLHTALEFVQQLHGPSVAFGALSAMAFSSLLWLGRQPKR